MNAAFLFLLALAALFLLWKVFALSDYFYHYWKATSAERREDAKAAKGQGSSAW